MRAEDLMLGDLVSWYDSPHEINIKDFEEAYNYKRPLINIYEPIPITPELLENNGLHKEIYKDGNDYDGLISFEYWVSEDKRILVDHLSNTIGKDWSVRIDNEDMQTIGSADIQHVHELQHALRLCGIEKEIIP